MKVVILCGGKGTRIREASDSVPKPMLPIGDRPIVWHIMKSFAAQGYREFVLCLGYKGWLIKEFFLNYRAMTADMTLTLGAHSAVEFHGGAEDEWRVTLADTGEETMTGGRVARIRRYVEGDEPFLLTYGDVISDLDVSALLSFHGLHGKAATVTAVRPHSRFGELKLDGQRVSEFNEKPLATEGVINGGFFVLDGRRIWDWIPDRPEVVFEREPLSRLAREGELHAYTHPGFWQPMDTYREFLLLNELWAGGAPPWKAWR